MDGLVLYYSIVIDPTNPSIGGILCAKIVLDRIGWIGFGLQAPTGGMNGNVVIGHYADGGITPVVKKCSLGGANQVDETFPSLPGSRL